MKVGDYVRTKNGEIFKWSKYNKIKEELELDFFDEDGDYSIFYKNDILKSSPNIIDLIEIGDYVNGCEVDKLKDKIVYLGCDTSLSNEMVDTIVTKEQFERMEYKVGKD